MDKIPSDERLSPTEAAGSSELVHAAEMQAELRQLLEKLQTQIGYQDLLELAEVKKLQSGAAITEKEIMRICEALTQEVKYFIVSHVLGAERNFPTLWPHILKLYEERIDSEAHR